MSKRAIISVFTVIISLILLFIVGFVNVGSKDRNAYVVEFRYETHDLVYEVRIVQPDNYRWLYRNGEKVRQLSATSIALSSTLQLPNSTLSLDIPGTKQQDEELTWKASLLESRAYTNYLENNGFKLAMNIEASTYIERYYVSATTTRRLLIFNNTIMIGDLIKGTRLPSVEGYLKNYEN